ncbi:MAG: Mrp/NBP35 family ATP-binding protein [Halioglobus sp.]|jgi:ATP-binding protein involved in chromosome partitioning|nr:Mrp/NBP35 family ATP-binding protein [Halioglobus sp.]
MPPKRDQVYDALRTVQDPDLGKDLVTLNMVKDVRIDGDQVHVHVELTTPACPMKDKIRQDVVAAVQAVDSTIRDVHVEFSADVRPPNEKLHDQQSPLPNVKHVIAVGAGKGGVGKSTIAANLAIGLAQHGAKAGLLDGDIYGPSMTTMLGLQEVPGRVRENTLLPFEVHGIKSMTIGKLVEPEKPLIWRGPMAHGAFKQLATQTDWGELDYLIVDLPPGTGDVPLTLAQLLPLTGAVVVCTPQKVAQDDARRAVRMFEQLGVAVLGIVENMSYFIADDGKEYDIFGRGGAEHMAKEMSLPFLGCLPIHMQLRKNCDNGQPLENWQQETLAAELNGLCQNLAQQVSIASASGAYVQPTLSVQ